MNVGVIIGIIAIGIATGLVTGLTGASGVMIVVPMVSMFLHLSIYEAIGTSLMVNVICSLAITYIYYKNGNVDFKSGIWIAIGSIIGSQFGTIFAKGIPELGLGISFGIFMTIMGIIIWIRGLNVTGGKTSKALITFKNSTQKRIVSVLLGFFVGIMTGIFGAGGGGMILLILIFVLNFPIHIAIGTSSFLMTITTFSGTIGYALQRSIQPVIGIILGIFASISGMISAKFANKVNEQILSKTIGLVFIIIGIIMSVFGSPRGKPILS